MFHQSSIYFFFSQKQHFRRFFDLVNNFLNDLGDFIYVSIDIFLKWVKKKCLIKVNSFLNSLSINITIYLQIWRLKFYRYSFFLIYLYTVEAVWFLKLYILKQKNQQKILAYLNSYNKSITIACYSESFNLDRNRILFKIAKRYFILLIIFQKFQKVIYLLYAK